MSGRAAKCNQVFGRQHFFGQRKKMVFLVFEVLTYGLDELAELLPRCAQIPVFGHLPDLLVQFAMFLGHLLHVSALGLHMVQGRVKEFLFLVPVSLQKPRHDAHEHAEFAQGRSIGQNGLDLFENGVKSRVFAPKKFGDCHGRLNINSVYLFCKSSQWFTTSITNVDIQSYVRRPKSLE